MVREPRILDRVYLTPMPACHFVSLRFLHLPGSSARQGTVRLGLSSTSSMVSSTAFLALTALLLVLGPCVQGQPDFRFPRPGPRFPLPDPFPCPYAGCDPTPWDPTVPHRLKRQLSVGVDAHQDGARVNLGHSGRWGDFSASGTFARGFRPSWGLSWSKTFRKRSANRGQ